MTDLRASLERLETLTSRLNAETNEVNSLINAVEAKLAESKLGHSVWLTLDRDFPLLNCELDDPDEQQIGFEEIGDRWRIAVRALRDSRPHQGEPANCRVSSEPRALVETSRLARVSACKYLGPLVDQLSLKAEGLLGKIVEAKKAVKP